MEIVKNLLSRYRNITPPEQHIKQALKDAIMDVCGVEVSLDGIQIQNNNAFITVPSVVKSEIFEQQKSVLSVAKNSVGDKFFVTTIR